MKTEKYKALPEWKAYLEIKEHFWAAANDGGSHAMDVISREGYIAPARKKLINAIGKMILRELEGDEYWNSVEMNPEIRSVDISIAERPAPNDAMPCFHLINQPDQGRGDWAFQFLGLSDEIRMDEDLVHYPADGGTELRFKSCGPKTHTYLISGWQVEWDMWYDREEAYTSIRNKKAIVFFNRESGDSLDQTITKGIEAYETQKGVASISRLANMARDRENIEENE